MSDAGVVGESRSFGASGEFRFLDDSHVALVAFENAVKFMSFVANAVDVKLEDVE